jgi:hypothetical protein
MNDDCDETMEMLQLRLTYEQVARFKSVAEVFSRSLDEWAINVLESAAHSETPAVEH